MYLDQLAQIGEFIGGIAVLVTLAYLAVQIRHSNKLARDTASHHWTEFNFALISSVVEDRELADIWIRGAGEFDGLDPVEQQRIVLFEWRAFEAWHHAFHQRQAGILADHQWEKVMAIIEGPIGERQALRHAWEAFGHIYDDAFRALIERHLGSSVRAVPRRG